MNRPTIPASSEVHIWFGSLDLQGAELARREQYLSPDERVRADRLLDRQTRERFVAGRCFLRESLARYLGLKPANLRFAAGEHGKPRLVEAAGSGSLSFNLSHADDSAILAVADNRAVGIDLERLRDDLQFRDIALQFYSSRERTELFSLPPDLQLAAFFRCWTRKEAYLKGCGRGFSQPSDSFDVSLLPGHPPALIGHRLAPNETSRWTLADIPMPAGYCAALAVEGDHPVICYPA